MDDHQNQIKSNVAVETVETVETIDNVVVKNSDSNNPNPRESESKPPATQGVSSPNKFNTPPASALNTPVRQLIKLSATIPPPASQIDQITEPAGAPPVQEDAETAAITPGPGVEIPKPVKTIYTGDLYKASHKFHTSKSRKGKKVQYYIKLNTVDDQPYYEPTE